MDSGDVVVVDVNQVVRRGCRLMGEGALETLAGRRVVEVYIGSGVRSARAEARE